MSVLDDLKMIHERDAQDALGVAESQWKQLLHNYDLPEIPGDFSNIVYAGMGGSSLSASLSQTWPGHKIPFEVCRTYDIPAYVNQNTLFIAASFSGSTEETLSALAQAESKGAKIVVISSGGKLSEIALEKGYPLAKLPEISQPRYATLAILKAIIEILVATGQCDVSKITDLENLAKELEPNLKKFRADVPTDQNPAKQLALELAGNSVVVYASSLFYPVAYKWKISFNENAKNVAWCNAYPEFNHNEFLGWSSHPVDKPYKIINLLSSFDHPQIQKRFEVSERMLSGKKPPAEHVELQGETILQQMIYGTTFGDFVSLYLALINGLNPSPVDLIQKLKAELI
jgi:glucose/mannose-6-phosphate isomerase